MDNFLSKELLQNLRNTRYFSVILENAQQELLSKSTYNRVKVFLSHKHSDKKILDEVIMLLKNLGVQVYVDWNDSGIPSTTSSYTAYRIKKKIQECEKFILIATEDAIASKWCNWELGYGDALRFESKDIAIMPIKNTNFSSFSGSEYLRLYPVITTEYATLLGKCYVKYDNETILLSDWLKR